jgi:hypothetical protein
MVGDKSSAYSFFKKMGLIHSPKLIAQKTKLITFENNCMKCLNIKPFLSLDSIYLPVWYSLDLIVNLIILFVFLAFLGFNENCNLIGIITSNFFFFSFIIAIFVIFSALLNMRLQKIVKGKYTDFEGDVFTSYFHLEFYLDLFLITAILILLVFDYSILGIHFLKIYLQDL